MHDKVYSVITIDPAPPIYSAGTVISIHGSLLRYARTILIRTARSALVLQSIIPKSYDHANIPKCISSYVALEGTVYKGLYLIGTQTRSRYRSIVFAEHSQIRNSWKI